MRDWLTMSPDEMANPDKGDPTHFGSAAKRHAQAKRVTYESRAAASKTLVMPIDSSRGEDGQMALLPEPDPLGTMDLCDATEEAGSTDDDWRRPRSGNGPFDDGGVHHC